MLVFFSRPWLFGIFVFCSHSGCLPCLWSLHQVSHGKRCAAPFFLLSGSFFCLLFSPFSQVGAARNCMEMNILSAGSRLLFRYLAGRQHSMLQWSELFLHLAN